MAKIRKFSRRGEASITHGHAIGKPTKVYKAWLDIKFRCFNRKSNRYKNYGERGITICDKWNSSFAAFYADVGDPPGPGYSLDRYPNNNGNYEPGNVRWATQEDNQNNRSNNIVVTYKGETLTLPQWARKTGLKYGCLQSRYYNGDVGDRLFRPRQVSPVLKGQKIGKHKEKLKE